MKILKTETDSVDVARTALEDIRIDYIISDDVFEIHFKEINHGHSKMAACDRGYRQTVKIAFDGQKLAFQKGSAKYVEQALDHWLVAPNTRYSPTPNRWMESIWSLSMMSKEIGRDQASGNPIKISENGIADIIARLAVMASLQSLTEIDPVELQRKVRDIIVSGLPAVIGRKVTA